MTASLPTITGLSPTEALLAAAAAETPQEMGAARRALIATGSRAFEGPDLTLLIHGDGRAGRHLLAAGARLRSRAAWSCGARSVVLERRMYRELEDADRPDVDLTNLPMGGAS